MSTGASRRRPATIALHGSSEKSSLSSARPSGTAVAITALVSFVLGMVVMMNYHASLTSPSLTTTLERIPLSPTAVATTPTRNESHDVEDRSVELRQQQRVIHALQEEVKELKLQNKQDAKLLQDLQANNAVCDDKEPSTGDEEDELLPLDQNIPGQASLFPSKTMGKYMVAMGRVSRANLTALIDFGVPVDQPFPGLDEALILYHSASAIPAKHRRRASTQVLELNAHEALAECNQLNVIFRAESSKNKQCTAIVPQYESYYVQKYLRVGLLDETFQATNPLRHVSRNHQLTGLKFQFKPPREDITRKGWDMMAQYSHTLDDLLADLTPILEKIAIDNTVIVMVANFGHSELLMNFCCAAHARSLNVSNVLVFTTDQETADLAAGLGLTAYYDERNFGEIPAQAAARYGDARFVAMMMAKVLCVVGPSILGYNILFQDVDIVWYSNPLDYFHNTSNPMIEYFDAFFQDDGAHSIRYAPWSANSGFYYVKANDRTQHFLLAIPSAADLIMRTDSHQQALIAVMSEHVSLFGLRIKVLARELDEFPGGYQFNQKSGNYMRSFFRGEKKPIIFHMSWTNNKINKLKFFQQMGEWHVDTRCVQKKRDEIVKSPDDADLRSTCCVAPPIVTCHFADKPSVIPCPKSPLIDRGKRKPFW